MVKIYSLFLLALLSSACSLKSSSSFNENPYPGQAGRTASKGNTTYFIDPGSGNDENKGTSKDAPWKTFSKVNQLILAKGDKVEVLSPGALHESAYIIAKGTQEQPVVIQFAPGRYDFFPKNAFKRKFHISNTNDSPDSLKAVALYFRKCENIKIEGAGAEFVFRGKVIETCIDSCSNISIKGISFDYNRPTVSEMKIVSVTNDHADAVIHKDSKYEIKNNTLIWIGEGWEHKAQNLWQVYDPSTEDLYRKNLPVNRLRFSQISGNKIRIHFDKNPGFKTGLIYQNRNTFRDYAAVFMRNSTNITWKNINVYFMHGMGFVSQFCENITFESFNVRPEANSGRTCAAWADILHFSGCSGQLKISNCYLSGANDDAVNVHGTHLRITDVIAPKTIKVKFMHPQTYGFDAFFPGDSIELIRAKTLLPFSKNLVTQTKKLNDKEYRLTLKDDVPGNIKKNDVVENITRTADVIIRNTTITHIPTRGVLVTTRGHVLFENNNFLKTHMSAILIADDANSWYESGYVTDVLVRKNKFIDCGQPVINIHPENKETVKGEYVHKNIRIKDNFFKLKKGPVLSAKSTERIIFSDNTIEVPGIVTMDDLIVQKNCEDVTIEKNRIEAPR